MSDGRLVQHAGLMDMGAAAIAVGTILDHLPALSALMSVLWLGIQMYESKPGERARNAIRRFLIRRGPF